MPTLRQSQRQSHGNSSDETSGTVLAEALLYLKSEWDWSSNQISQMLHIPTSTINTWLQRKQIPFSDPPSPDTQAIIHLIAIHNSLHSMFEKAEHQLKWLETPHPDMGVPPIEAIQGSIEGMIGVRQYLDYARGRGA